MEENRKEIVMPSGNPELELQEIKKSLSKEDGINSLTDICGGFCTIICCGSDSQGVADSMSHCPLNWRGNVMLNEIGKIIFGRIRECFQKEDALIYEYIQQCNFLTLRLKDDYLTNQIYDGISDISIRAIIEDLYQYYSSGENMDYDSKAIYDNYLKKLDSTEYIHRLFEQYPELKKQIMNTVKQCYDNFIEFCKYFISDKIDIAQKLCLTQGFKRIMKIEGSISDKHNGGKSVLRVYLDNGDIIYYKPHNMDNDLAWYQLVTWFYKQCGLDTYEFPILSYPQHSWCGHVSALECSNLEQVERYYLRFGIQLFIAWLFGISDLHCENIVAHGEYPVFVDMELFPGKGTLQPDMSAEGFTQYMIKNSVLSTGALPFILWDTQGNGVNLSAINENGRIRMPFKVPAIANPETGQMHIEYIYPEKFVQGNSVRIKQRTICAHEFMESICNGFVQGWKCICNQKDEFSNRMKPLFNLKARYILQHTQQYLMLLRLSYHPWYMIGYDARMKMFQNLKEGYWGKSEFMEDIIRYEKESLYLGDIPYFQVSGCNRDLLAGKYIFKNYFAKSPYEQFLEKLDTADEGIIKYQLEFIRISMALLKSDKQISCATHQNFKVSSVSNLMNISNDIAKWIVEHAVLGDDGNTVNWAGVKLLGSAGKQWKITPLDIYLYDGLAGVAVFINAWLRFSGKSFSFIEAADKVKRRLDKTLFSYTDALLNQKALDKKDTGIFAGEGSLVYTYLLLHKITGDVRYLNYAKKHSKILVRYVDMDTNYDILSGNAGTVIAFLLMFQITSDIKYLEGARYTGDVLLEKAEKYPEFIVWPAVNGGAPLAGMAHGCSGYIVAFARLAEYTGEKRYREIVERIMAYENALYREKINNWLDLRGVEDRSTKEVYTSPEFMTGNDQVAWCHGAAGVLLSRLEICELQDIDNWNSELLKRAKIDIKRAVKKIRVDGIGDNLCMCHGLAGNLSVLDTMSDNKERDEADWGLTEALYAGLGNRYPHERYNPGFMTGIAGVGYALLSHNDGYLPNVLRMKI